MVGSARAFPVAPEQLTPDWLTDVLHDAGCITDGRITSLATERIGEGVGFLGQLVRITPVYDHAYDDAPRALIAKFPSPEEPARQFAASYGLYRCEVNFYREIAGSISLRTPRCYYSRMNDDATEFLLLLEDLSATGRLGDQVAGCTLDDARLAIRELARFHASWWQHPALEQMDWLPRGVELGRISLEEAYPHGWRPCLDRYRHLLSPDLQRAAPALNERLLRMFPRFERAPTTIMHADYRLDNMFFGTPGSGYDLAVIDWQIANRGWGAYDVAYFLGSNLDPAERRAHEASLLRDYHRTLLEAGSRDYSWELCQEDYTLSLITYLANLIGNVASLDPTNERGLALFELLFTRVVAAVTDLNALDALA